MNWIDFLIDGRKIISSEILSILSIFLYVKFQIEIYPFYDLILPHAFYILEYEYRNFIILFNFTYNILFSYFISTLIIVFFDIIKGKMDQRLKNGNGKEF